MWKQRRGSRGAFPGKLNAALSVLRPGAEGVYTSSRPVMMHWSGSCVAGALFRCPPSHMGTVCAGACRSFPNRGCVSSGNCRLADFGKGHLFLMIST